MTSRYVRKPRNPIVEILLAAFCCGASWAILFKVIPEVVK